MKGKNNTNQKIERLAKKLAGLVEIFRRGGEASDSQWWSGKTARSIFYPLYGYQKGQPLFEEVVQGVLKLNPEMLSEYEVHKRLMHEFLSTQTIDYKAKEHLYNQSLVYGAKNLLNEMIKFEAYHYVDIPIANLWHEGEPIEFLGVTFREATGNELKQWEKNLEEFWHEGTHNVHVLARVKAPGDEAKSIEYARNQVDTVLEVFRAFCFPFGRNSSTWRVGIVGDVLSYSSTPVSVSNRYYITRIFNGPMQVELKKHILSELEQAQWKLISESIQQTHYTKMEKKLRDSMHWLSESTKPDTNNAKFAKISFALETLIGGEAQDEELKVRGVTSMLAERAAFIGGRGLDDRCAIDKDIRKYYGMRGGIVHGGGENASLDDIDNFGQLVRRLVLALMEKLEETGDEIGDVDGLEKWLKVQKYTLPD